jgi:uridine kinase
MSDVYILGVAGGSGSGKTFFAQTLAKKLGPDTSFVLYQDNYYIDQSHRFDRDGGAVNFDHPHALDFDLMAEHLDELRRGNDIRIPLYDFKTHQRLEKSQHQPSKRVVIVDGILILTQPHVRDLFDDSIFVHTPEEIRFQRRLSRDVEERGRTPEGVFEQFHAQVKPMHDEFVEPSKEHATYVSSGTDMEKFYSLLNHIQRRIHTPVNRQAQQGHDVFKNFFSDGFN